MKMNLIDRAGAWLVDRLNPIVTKELRQSMKGRMFHIWFLIVIVVGTAVTLIASWLAEDNPATDWGLDVFLWFVFFLNFLAIALVPMTAYLNLSLERDDRTLELVNISGLSPSQVIRGKIFSTLVQAGLYVSAIIPFMAFTYFLGGIDVLSIGFILLLQILAAVLFTTIAIAVATSISLRPVRLIVGGILALGLIGISILGVPAAWEIARSQLAQEILTHWNEAASLKALAALLLTYGGILALAYAIAVANASFSSANRATPMRSVLLLQWLGLMGLMSWVYLDDEIGARYETLIGFGASFAMFWTVVGFFLAGETARLSKRTWRGLELRARETRLLLSPLLPGVERGMIFFVGLILLTGAWQSALVAIRAPDPATVHNYTSSFAGWRDITILWLGYAAAYILLPWHFVALLRVKEGARVRVAILIAITLGFIVPLMSLLFLSFRTLNSGEELMLFGSNPFYVTFALSRYGETPVGLLVVVGSLATLGIILTLMRGLPRLIPRGPEVDRT